MLPFFYFSSSLTPGAGPKKYTYPSSCHIHKNSLREESKAPRGCPWVGAGVGDCGSRSGHYCQATGRGITICPSPLYLVTWVTVTCSWASRLVGHSLSPHARQVPQASLPPTGGASCSPIWSSLCHAMPGLSHLSSKPGPSPAPTSSSGGRGP